MSKKAISKFNKNKAHMRELHKSKLVFIVGVTPVIADFLYDLDLDSKESDFKALHDLIRKIDENVMQCPVDPKSTNPEDIERLEHYNRTVDSQIIIQRKFREFYKELCNENEEM